MSSIAWISSPPIWPIARKGKMRQEKHMLLARVYVRHQRDLLMQTAVNVLKAHTRRVGMDLPGTLTFDEACEVRDYIAKLCDVPQQKGFPYEVEWPDTPAALRKNIIS